MADIIIPETSIHGPGLCECGCGGRTSIAKMTATRYGHIQGQPVRYIVGHATRKPFLERFEGFLKRDEATGCLIYCGLRDRRGYGMINIGCQRHFAHRVAWVLAGNEITKEITLRAVRFLIYGPEHAPKTLTTCQEKTEGAKARWDSPLVFRKQGTKKDSKVTCG